MPSTHHSWATCSHKINFHSRHHMERTNFLRALAMLSAYPRASCNKDNKVNRKQNNVSDSIYSIILFGLSKTLSLTCFPITELVVCNRYDAIWLMLLSMQADRSMPKGTHGINKLIKNSYVCFRTTWKFGKVVLFTLRRSVFWFRWHVSLEVAFSYLVLEIRFVYVKDQCNEHILM